MAVGFLPARLRIDDSPDNRLKCLTHLAESLYPFAPSRTRFTRCAAPSPAVYSAGKIWREDV